MIYIYLTDVRNVMLLIIRKLKAKNNTYWVNSRNSGNRTKDQLGLTRGFQELTSILTFWSFTRQTFNCQVGMGSVKWVTLVTWLYEDPSMYFRLICTKFKHPIKRHGTILSDQSPSIPKVSGNLAWFEGETPALCVNDKPQLISLTLSGMVPSRKQNYASPEETFLDGGGLTFFCSKNQKIRFQIPGNDTKEKTIVSQEQDLEECFVNQVLPFVTGFKQLQMLSKSSFIRLSCLVRSLSIAF